MKFWRLSDTVNIAPSHAKDDDEIDSLVTSIAFVMIALYWQIAEECSILHLSVNLFVLISLI